MISPSNDFDIATDTNTDAPLLVSAVLSTIETQLCDSIRNANHTDLPRISPTFPQPLRSQSSVPNGVSNLGFTSFFEVKISIANSY
jgi:hypothetical protein